MATSELNYLRHVWPRALFAFMSRYQQDLKRMRKECKELYTLWQVHPAVSQNLVFICYMFLVEHFCACEHFNLGVTHR